MTQRPCVKPADADCLLLLCVDTHITRRRQHARMPLLTPARPRKINPANESLPLIEIGLLGRHVAQIRARLNKVAVGALDGAVQTFDHRHGFLLTECFTQPVAQGLYCRIIFERSPVRVVEGENIGPAGPTIRQAIP